MKKLILFLVTLLILSPTQLVLAQKIAMADALRASGKIYVVVVVIGIILLGIFLYLMNIDRKIKRLEKRLKDS